MEKISVIIPSYNSRDTIGPCIQSVINARYPHLEIIVVDDCSTDDSPQIIEQYRQKYPGMVKLVRQNNNSGPAKARNAGAGIASGDYLFFLDSDTDMLPDALRNFAERIKECDAVTGIYYYEPINEGLVPTYKAMLNYYFFSRKGSIPYEVFDSSRAGIKTDVFRRLGGFNEDLSWGMDCENEEFGYRLTTGHVNILDPDVAVRHVFPGFKKLTVTYFKRVALWMEVFMQRKKFESGGATSAGTGISSAALLLSVFFVPFACFYPSAGYLSLLLFFIYIYGYSGFWAFVLKNKPMFFIPAILLNNYFTLILASGALWGFLRRCSGKSAIKSHSEILSP